MPKRIMKCTVKNWDGKVCYGKSFNIELERDNSLYSVCEKCGARKLLTLGVRK